MFVEYRKGFDIVKLKNADGKIYYGIKEHMCRGIILAFGTLQDARNCIDFKLS